WRHGPMVLRTCQRILGHRQDAEDAFQATFLVLCRKAVAISNREGAGAWIYRVAYRVALRARADSARRASAGLRIADLAAPPSPPEAELAELRPVLDDELNRLPEKYRAPLVLHYLEGMTVGQVARELGCPEGTVCGRLARARTLLRPRLSRRGVA